MQKIYGKTCIGFLRQQPAIEGQNAKSPRFTFGLSAPIQLPDLGGCLGSNFLEMQNELIF